MEQDSPIEMLKRRLEDHWYSGTSKELSLVYRNAELSEDRPLKYYGVEDHSLLGFKEKSPSSKRTEDRKSISCSKRWLKDNIGEDGLVLNEFSRGEEGSKEVLFKSRKDGAMFILTVSGESVLDYRYEG